MSYLDLTKKLAATVAKRQRAIDVETPRFDLEAGRLLAARLSGTAIGDVWLVADDRALAEHPDIIRSGLPVFFFDEIERLGSKTADELKAITSVKSVFPTGRLLQ